MSLATGVLLFDVLGVITAFLAIGIAYYKWAFQYWKTRNVPYFEPSIPFGNIPNPFKNVSVLGSAFPDIYNQAKSKGWKYVGVYGMARPMLMIVDLDALKYILTKDFNNFVDRGFYHNEKDDPISAHLFAIGGEKWKNLRAKISPTFTSGKLKVMFQTLVDTGVILEKYIEEHANSKEAIDIKDVLACFSTDFIGSCGFGLNINSFKDPGTPLRKYSKQFLSPTGIAGLRFLFGQSFPNVAKSLGIRAVPKEVSEYFTKVVEDVVSHREKTNTNRNDFLQLLINMKNNKNQEESGTTGDGKHLNMNEIVAQCFVFFMAGFETSSTTMTFALYELATQPKIQEKLKKEIKTVLAKHDNQVTYDSLSEMKYMGQVIDETLRKYPPVPFITRDAGEDYKIPGENVVIEKGIQVLIPINAYHYDEEVYPEPNVFDPDRFSNENKRGRHAYSHIPFGAGPRACIGERLGIMQTKIGLTSVLRNSSVTLNKKTNVPLKMATDSLVPAAEGGIWIDIIKD